MPLKKDQRCFASLNMTGSKLSFAPLLAKFAHQLHRFIDNFRRNIERRTTPDRVFTGTQGENTKVEKALPEPFARLRIGKIECEKQTLAARGGNQRLFVLQLMQLIQKICAHF